jgi:alcohol dehydrogenase
MGNAPFRFELGGVDAIFGAGELERLGELATGLGLNRVLLVTDPGLLAAGHPQRAKQLLEAAGVAATLFADTAENPSTREVDAGAAAALEAGADGLVAIGGGSALDTCRGINFLFSGGGRMEDYWGPDEPARLAGKTMLPMIGIPTTAGTGSEAQRFALISQAETHLKMACGDRRARFCRVILDPSLLASAPRQVAALSGIDAISHAVESFVSTAASPFSRMLALDAWKRLESSFAAHLDSPADPAPAAAMLLGSHLAGAAIEASMLGAAHACANPLTAAFGTRHGAAVALMLPHVVRLNAEAAAPLYARLAEAAGLAGIDALVARLTFLRRIAGLPQTLGEIGVPENELPALAAGAARQWTARFNPRPVGETDLLGLYRRAYSEAA